MEHSLEIAPDLAGARVMVTGSSGMLGQAIVPMLKMAGARVACLDLCSHELCLSEDDWFEQGDICDRAKVFEFCSKVQPTHLINLAAECGSEAPEKLEDFSANSTGVEIMCDVAESFDSVQHLIHTSSQTVCKVGYQPRSDNEFCPTSVYGQSKVLGEQVVRARNGGEKPWTIVRPTTVWGPGINLDILQQHFIYHIHRGTYFHIGSDALDKSYSFVGNIAYQYLKLLTVPRSLVSREVFYLADYEVLSIREMADSLAIAMGVRKPFTMPLFLAKSLALVGDLICKMGMKFPFQSRRLANMRLEYIYDLSKTEVVCGELPYSFDDGVDIFAKWYLDQIENK